MDHYGVVHNSPCQFIDPHGRKHDNPLHFINDTGTIHENLFLPKPKQHQFIGHHRCPPPTTMSRSVHKIAEMQREQNEKIVNEAWLEKEGLSYRMAYLLNSPTFFFATAAPSDTAPVDFVSTSTQEEL